jgi:hypothetical protein
VIDIKSGYLFSMLLRSNGKVYLFGKNDDGSLGNGEFNNGDSATPISIVPERNYGIFKIACAEGSGYILQSNSNCFGKNSSEENVCSGRGICVDQDKCLCDTQYTGNNCQYPICNGIDSSNPKVCSGRGSCISPETCTCKPSSSGTYCENYLCYGIDSKQPDVCSSRGVCTEIDTCNCTLRNIGENCQHNIGLTLF